MNLARRPNESTRPLAHFRNEMDDLFHRFLGDWDLGWPGLAPLGGGWCPSVDVCEQDDRITVKAELPGVESEDVEVSVHDGTLTIGGEKKEQSEDKGEGFYHSERRYGAFRRDIRLSVGVDADKVEATCRNGVLTVTLPKIEQAKAKRIEVKG